MTNETSYAPIKYVCNGITVDFTFPWKIFEEKDLIVQAQGESGLLRELTLGVDYSVEFDEVGGNVKLNQAYAEGDLVVISRNVSDYQIKSYSTSSGFQSSEIEDSFDRVSCNLQEMEYNIENFKEVFSAQVHDEIDALENVIEENKQEVLLIQERFEEEVDNKIANLKTDVDSKVESVANAADKINALDESIAKCESAASEASEQAQIATSKAEELLNVKDELEAEIENKADVDLSNLSKIGMRKIGGGGLEVGFIGFTQGYIDETKNLQRCLNKAVNYIIQDQFEEFTQWLKKSAELNPDIVCTNEEYETELTLSPNNVCQKFVIDDVAGTIRLPKYSDYLDLSINGAKTVSVYGTDKAVGFVNSTTLAKSIVLNGYGGNVGVISRVVDDPVPVGTASALGSTNPAAGALGLHHDPTKSGVVGSVTTTSEQIKGTYFIQVATGTSESIDTTRATEINNPFFFGQSAYFEATPNNPSWVKSTGTYLSKAVYPDYYDWLLKIYNGTETQEGVSVKDVSATDITDYDFVINQTDETFMLPLLNGSETIPSDKFEDLTIKETNSPYTAQANGYVKFQYRTDGIGSIIVLRTANIDNAQTSGVANQLLRVTIEVKRGQEYIVEYSSSSSNSSLNKLRFTYSRGNGDLYYYVGEGMVNPQLVNVARIEEVKANKTDVDGQWVSLNNIRALEWTNITSASPLEIDLSSYIPDDGYDYLVSAHMNFNGTTLNYCTMYGTGTAFTGTLSLSVYNQVVNATISARGLVYVDTNRKIHIATGAASGSKTSCALLGYRRIGTNQ